MNKNLTRSGSESPPGQVRYGYENIQRSALLIVPPNCMASMI